MRLIQVEDMQVSKAEGEFTAVIAPTDLPSVPFMRLFHNESVPEYMIVYGEYSFEREFGHEFVKPQAVVAQVGDNVCDITAYIDMGHLESLLQDNKKIRDFLDNRAILKA